MKRPRVFIGSSTESLGVAYNIQKALEHSCEATVWTQGVFKLTQSSLSSLIRALDDFEHAVFVLTPDDVIKLRQQEYVAARDNVLFELGLFIGRCGVEHVFMVLPRNSDLHVPTDLLGITPATYDAARSDSNLAAALGPACLEIQESILERSRPRYSESLIDEFRDLENRFAEGLKARIRRTKFPDDFPMPDSLDALPPLRLVTILQLGIGRAEAVDAFGYHSCLWRAEERGTPASALEEYEFKEGLQAFRDRLVKAGS